MLYYIPCTTETAVPCIRPAVLHIVHMCVYRSNEASSGIVQLMHDCFSTAPMLRPSAKIIIQQINESGGSTP